MAYTIHLDNAITHIGPEQLTLEHLYLTPLYRVETGLGTPDLLVALGSGGPVAYWDGVAPVKRGLPLLKTDNFLIAPSLLFRVINPKSAEWHEAYGAFIIIMNRLIERVRADWMEGYRLPDNVTEIWLGNESDYSAGIAGMITIDREDWEAPRLYFTGSESAQQDGGNITLTLIPADTKLSGLNQVMTLKGAGFKQGDRDSLCDLLRQHTTATGVVLDKMVDLYIQEMANRILRDSLMVMPGAPVGDVGRITYVGKNENPRHSSWREV